MTLEDQRCRDLLITNKCEKFYPDARQASGVLL